MASLHIHLAIAMEYAKKHNIEDVEKFMQGSIAPDCAQDKVASHYTSYINKEDLERYLSEKTRLDLFLKNEKVDSDYQRGVFLHLITDYIFFNGFFDKQYIETVPYREFIQDLYYSYRVTNGYLEDKYNIKSLNFYNKINENVNNAFKTRGIDNTVPRRNILPTSKLDNFIDYMSDIDLQKYERKVIEVQGNPTIRSGELMSHNDTGR